MRLIPAEVDDGVRAALSALCRTRGAIRLIAHQNVVKCARLRLPLHRGVGAPIGVCMQFDHASAGLSARASTNLSIASLERLAPYLLSILRIVAALLFLEHGMSRLFGFPSPLPTPHLFTMYWFAGAIELTGSALVLVGLFTRPVAFIMSGEMAFAYFISHAPRGFFPILNSGDGAILYCFVFLYIAFAGAGPWSLDAVRRGRA
jgi:putative oxidoreductase